MPRLLLLLPQMPQDPASGAARSLRTMAEMLATAGWQVRSLAATASEGAAFTSPTDFLRHTGLDVTVIPPQRAIYRHDRPVLEFTDSRGIFYRLLDTGDEPAAKWQLKYDSQINRLYHRELADFRPDVLLGYGGYEPDRERYRRAQALGAKVVFGLRNHGYKEADWLKGLDAVLTPSQFLSGVYRDALGLDSIALPTPLEMADVVAPDREPIFFTAINPSIEKGMFFLARLAEELSLRRPDVPMLFIESRGSAGVLVQAGLVGGFDLRRHENLMFAPAVAQPAEIYRGARALLVPSVWPEPSGRVVPEALVNGVPPIVSDRGGLAESAHGGGFVLPLPESLTLESREPVAAEAVTPWIELIERLADDDAFYAESSARARAAGEIFQTANLAPRYVEFFERVLRGEKTRGI